METRWLLWGIVGSVVTLAVLASPCPALAQAGFVWADQPSAKGYEPNREYSYNASGGRNTIGRMGIGAYAVRFGGLGGAGRGRGHVQVTAYGASSDTCKVESWDVPSAAPRDFIVHVRCFSPNGSPTDSQYTVLAGWFSQAGSSPGLSPLPSRPLPVGRGGDKAGGGDGKSDSASSTDARALSNQINALYTMVEELRRRVNDLSAAR
jgi:hypothetical protein